MPLSIRFVTAIVLFAGAISLHSAPATTRRMSFHNRLLLNRATVTGLRTLEVMVAAVDGRSPDVSAETLRVGGRVVKTEAAVDYLRVDIPTERLVEFAASPAIAAYQIASLSRGTWYRDGPPQMEAEMIRAIERSVLATPSTTKPAIDLPQLTPTQARGAGYTGDEDSGVGDWRTAHPTFDGRGVTIALLESAMPNFSHPTIGSAKSLDGQDIPKLVGIVNTLADDVQDNTKVQLGDVIVAKPGWNRTGELTYVFPRTGRFRFGLFKVWVSRTLRQQFGVLRDEDTGEVWVDANDDGDFRDEPPIIDVNARMDVRALKITSPKPWDLTFVVAHGRTPDVVHIYPSTSSHQAMTLSVAAGSETNEGLARGVAPGARVLLVRNNAPQHYVRNYVESYLEIMKRPDVDVISDSASVDMVPNTAADFMGLLFDRMIAVYGKPIFHGAGNVHGFLSSASSQGKRVFTVGGSIGPRTFTALYGGATLPEIIVHPVASNGPSIDGAIKPDFVTTVNLLSATIPSSAPPDLLPANAPTAWLPGDYEISCCTSSSGPYAAGVGALVISAAKQQHIPWTAESLGRALRVGARFIDGTPASDQGNGVLHVERAWNELQRRNDVPQITSEANIAHPFATTAAQGAVGSGLFERDGWVVGMEGIRTIRFRRDSGPAANIRYRVSWTGNDGTFATDSEINLRLGQFVPLPIHITASSPGRHSAIVNLHDPTSDAIVYRTETTIVASTTLSSSNPEIRIDGTVALMKRNEHYFTVPSNTGAVVIQLDVRRGSVYAEEIPAHGLYVDYYPAVFPMNSRVFTRGTYQLSLPAPVAGTWVVQISNTTASVPEPDRTVISTETAEYTLTIKILKTSLQARRVGPNRVQIDVDNRGAALAEPRVAVSTAHRTVVKDRARSSGLPNLFEIDVPKGAQTLAVNVRGAHDRETLELYLYDCSSAECFSYNLAFPAANRQALVVRQPAAGRWVAVVNAAPFPNGPVELELEEIVAMSTVTQSVSARPNRPAASRWTDTIDIPANILHSGDTLFVELFDNEVNRLEQERLWDPRKNRSPLANRPIAAGMTAVRLQ